MKLFSFGRPALLAAVAALLFVGCDASEQNIGWEPGTSLAITGPIAAGGAAIDHSSAAGTQVYLPVFPNDLSNNDIYFYVNGFNSDRTYTWSVNGQQVESIQGGEFMRMTLVEGVSELRDYVVEVSNGTFSGSRQFTLLNPNLNIQLPRFTALGTLVSLLNATELTAALAADGPFTVFAPVNAAFVALLDADEDGEIGDDEQLDLENEAVLEAVEGILLRHVVPGRIRAADITNGQTATTLSGETLTFNRSGDTITVTYPGGPTATVTGPADVNVGNGVIHGLDTVLATTDDLPVEDEDEDEDDENDES